MILVIGEILFDIFPEYKRLGGAPFNFAYHLKKLGFDARFVSRIGRDANGQKILERLREAGFDPEEIQIDASRSTGRVLVELDRSGVPDFAIVPDAAYDRIEFRPQVHSETMDRCRFVYFGSLAQRTDHGFRQIGRFLDRKPAGGTAFYDINLRPDGYTPEVVLASLARADVLKLNGDELRECRRITGSGLEGDDLVRQLMDRYRLRMVAVTDGENGSRLFAGKERFSSGPAPAGPVVDTVGAGDAYAAMLAAGLMREWPLEKTLAMATMFASRVCAIPGAVPESDGFYEPVLEQMGERG